MLQTRFTAHFGCKYPIMLAPMANVSGGRLAAAVAKGGGYPFIAGGHGDNVKALVHECGHDATTAAQVNVFKELAPGKAFGVGLISYSALGINKVLKEVVTACKPDAMQFHAPGVYDSSVISKCREHGVKVIAQCTSLAEASNAAAAGVDAVMTQGFEAGGHSARPDRGRATLPLALAAVTALRGTNTQVVYAGGIVDGRGVAAALALGCDAVAMGTRFWACQESLGNPKIRQRLAECGGDDTVRTRVFDIMGHIVNDPYGWPEPHDTVRAIRNSFTDKWHGREDVLEKELRTNGRESLVVKEYLQALQHGDSNVAPTLCGEGIDLIRDIERADDVMDRIVQETIETIQRLQRLVT